MLGLRGGGFGSSRGSGGDDSDDNSDAGDEGSDGEGADQPNNADASDDYSGPGEDDPDRVSLGQEDLARLFSPRAHQWGERAVSAAFVADAAALLSRTGHLKAAAEAYKLSLLLAPSDWPPCSRLMAALATALREAWEQRQQAPAEIHSPPENNGGAGVFDDALLLLRAASARRPEDPTLLFQVGPPRPGRDPTPSAPCALRTAPELCLSLRFASRGATPFPRNLRRRARRRTCAAARTPRRTRTQQPATRRCRAGTPTGRAWRPS